MRGCVSILNGSDTVPAENVTLANNDEGEEMLRLRKVNEKRYRDLVLATKEMSLTFVGNAKRNSLSRGDLQLAWKKFRKRWDPKTREDKVDLLIKFMKLRMEDVHITPQDWLAYMEKKKMESMNSGHFMNKETFLTYVVMSLPQEEYQTMILVLKHKLRKGTLTIEEAKISWMIDLKP